jgi:hypothetical protein
MSVLLATPASRRQEALRALLRPGERLLWSGGPDVRAYTLRGAWFIVPFSILWGGFAIFWEVSALSARAPLPFALFGLPFVAVGLYLIFGRLLVAKREAERSVYALTDQRVIQLVGAFRQTLTEIALRDLPPLSLTQQPGGLGTITFGAVTYPFRIPPGWPTMGQYARPLAFDAIPEAARVYSMIQEARNAPTR